MPDDVEFVPAQIGGHGQRAVVRLTSPGIGDRGSADGESAAGDRGDGASRPGWHRPSTSSAGRAALVLCNDVLVPHAPAEVDDAGGDVVDVDVQSKAGRAVAGQSQHGRRPADADRAGDRAQFANQTSADELVDEAAGGGAVQSGAGGDGRTRDLACGSGGHAAQGQPQVVTAQAADLAGCWRAAGDESEVIADSSPGPWGDGPGPSKIPAVTGVGERLFVWPCNKQRHWPAEAENGRSRLGLGSGPERYRSRETL